MSRLSAAQIEVGGAQFETTPEGHKLAAKQFLEMVAAGKIEEAYQKFITPTGHHHNPFFPQGFTALQAAMQESHAQYPEMRLTVKHVIGEGNLVAVHSQVVMRPGEAGTATVHLFRFEGDRIVELWDIAQPPPASSPNQDGMF